MVERITMTQWKPSCSREEQVEMLAELLADQENITPPTIDDLQLAEAIISDVEKRVLKDHSQTGHSQ
ncbi:hypothetical protein CSR02_15765 [Acetobacter pomorum]|uniref:Uncharacterized protein n=3 Tax=Acetobacter TaxID=434 RepID=A0A2G4R7Y5_9PROT|nr:hypothetical protein CSR02_15765 [Acetobacter pomorum]